MLPWTSSGDGDTLVVTKLDRLARSTAHLLQIAEALKAKGAGLKVLDLDLDTSTAIRISQAPSAAISGETSPGFGWSLFCEE